MSIDFFLMEIYSFQLLSHSLILMQGVLVFFFFFSYIMQNLYFIGLGFQKFSVCVWRHLHLLKNKLLTICEHFIYIYRSKLVTVDFCNFNVLFHAYRLLKEWKAAKTWMSLMLLHNSAMELRFSELMILLICQHIPQSPFRFILKITQRPCHPVV